MTLRTAVMKSKNTVAWKIYRDDITPKMGIGFLLNMGFHRVWMDKSTPGHMVKHLIRINQTGRTYHATL